MSKSTSNIVEFADPLIEKDLLTELIRLGDQQLLNQAVEIELEERMAELLKRRLPDGRQAVDVTAANLAPIKLDLTARYSHLPG